MLSFFTYLLPIFGVTTGLLSVLVQIILKRKGYQINYFYAEYLYEYKTLKKICSEERKYKPLLIAYKVSIILFTIDIILALLTIFH